MNNTECVEGVSCASTEDFLPKLSITKTVDRTEVSQYGDTLTYAVQVRNVGDSAYTESNPATFVDDVAGVLQAAIYNNDLAFSSGTAQFDKNTITWSGPLAPGAEATVSYSVTFGLGIDGSLDNTACIPDSEVVAGESACASTSTPGPNLSIWKTVAADTELVEAGSILTYTLHFKNTGQASALVNAEDLLNDVLPNAVMISEVESSGDLSARTDIQPTAIYVSGAVPSGGEETVTYQVRVKSAEDREDDVINNYIIRRDIPLEPVNCDPELELSTCTSTPVGNLKYKKTVQTSSEGYEPGTLLTYSIDITNEGQGPALVGKYDALDDVVDDATVESLPTSDNKSIEISEIENNRFFFSGVLGAGESARITYTVTINPIDQRGNNRINNYLLTDDGDSIPAPEEACFDECVRVPIPALKVTLTADPESELVVAANQDVNYIIEFTNSGQRTTSVDYINYLADLLDDANLTMLPISWNENLVLGFDTEGQISITGSLEPGESGLISYRVAIKEAEQRGNHVLTNYVAPNGAYSRDFCSEEDPLCALHPVEELVVSKKALVGDTPLLDAESETESNKVATVGQWITFVLTFKNLGVTEIPIEYVDDLADVLDSATWMDKVSTDSEIEIEKKDEILKISGLLMGNETASIRYAVKVNDTGNQNVGQSSPATNAIVNYLSPAGVVHPSTCENDNPLCTYTEVVSFTAQPKPTESAPPKTKPKESAAPQATLKESVQPTAFQQNVGREKTRSSGKSALARTGSPLVMVLGAATSLAAVGFGIVAKRRNRK